MAVNSAEMILYVYSGTPQFEGVVESSARALEERLKKHPVIVKTSFITALQLGEILEQPAKIEKGWERRVIIAFPGGECSVWDQQLKGVVIKIRSFVERGGNVLMICAGAYFSVKRSLYTSTNNIFERSRELAFFPGQAIGPKKTEKKDYDPDKKGVMCAVTNEISKKQGYGYLKGGGHFIPEEGALEGVHYEVIMRYSDETIAAVASKVGLGRAWMTFLHFEYEHMPDINKSSCMTPKNKRYLQKINKKLLENQDFSDEFFNQCLKYLQKTTTNSKVKVEAKEIENTTLQSR